MAEETGSADPSMEEILASIRKIISDDAPTVELVPAPETVAEPAPAEEVLELTQMVQDDGSVVDLKPADPVPEPEPEPAPPPVAAAPPPPPRTAPPTPERLVSEPAEKSAMSALSSLASTVEIERLSTSTQMGATFIGNGSRTLEDMVIELMRPLLKDWLDQNLPAVVDRLVQKEIERIARRS